MYKTPFDMNRQQRYESIPQRDEVIILDSIHSSSYNYNTALPTSVASSSHGGPPSTISTPGSPPPSFHTHSSPGTPRPSQSQLAGAQYAELWGVAPSTIGGDTIHTSNDALATIAGLRRRVDLLEESIGRLLLEKDSSVQNGGYDAANVHGNCCVSFTDASPDVEASLRNRQNCCVSYSGNTLSEAKRKEQRITLFALLFVAFLICGTIAVVATARAPRINRAVNKVVDEAFKLME